MTLDKHAAERRRFARLLGVDGEHGSGLPIGAVNRGGDEGDDRERARERGAGTEQRFATETDSEAPTDGD